MHVDGFSNPGADDSTRGWFSSPVVGFEADKGWYPNPKSEESD